MQGLRNRSKDNNLSKIDFGKTPCSNIVQKMKRFSHFTDSLCEEPVQL
jgi:hypothetical protein